MIRGLAQLRALSIPSTRLLSTAITYETLGNPMSVLKVSKMPPIGELKPTEVSIKILAAPINPADINMIEGVYGVKPNLPAIAGGEGVAVVKKTGSAVKGIKVGDWVIPASAASAFGTWREEGVAEASQLQIVPNDIPAAYAATIGVNPCTAYRMLRDFVSLKPGDVIMQNGANSMVGLAVVQMAREMGVKTINIVRADRVDADNTLRLLSGYGGDVNVLDTFVNTPGFREILSELPPCKLALNCVGGELVTDMARCLPEGATIVTYGGMSKRPVTIPYELLTYKQLNLRGFWVSQWHKNDDGKERTAMLTDISNMIRDKKLSFLFEMHDFDDFNYALEKSQEPCRLRKVVLNMDYPDRLKEHDARPADDYFVFETTVV
eukprot:gene3836-7637_t